METTEIVLTADRDVMGVPFKQGEKIQVPKWLAELLIKRGHAKKPAKIKPDKEKTK